MIEEVRVEHLKVQRKAAPDREQSAVHSPQQPTSTDAAQAAQGQMTAHLEPRYAHNYANISVFAPEHTVQRTAASRASEATEPNLNARIQATAGGGSPLEAAVQDQLEAGIGADLSNVRLHTDAEADQLSHELHANAFTTGNDVYFRQGLYNPNSSDGLRLLAHEATHTVQQANGAVDGVSWGGGVKVSDPSDRFERAAEATANNVMNSSRVDVAAPTGGSSGSSGVVQREAVVEEEDKDKLEKPEEKELQLERDSTRSSLSVQRDDKAPDPESFSTPVDDSYAVEKSGNATKNISAAANNNTSQDVKVTIKPDQFTLPKTSKSDGITSFNLKKKSEIVPKIEKGKVTSFTSATFELVIGTQYKKSLTKDSITKLDSDYGRGTTPEDTKSGNTSLKFHEGMHGQEAINFLQSNPFPVFEGKVDMTIKEFNSAKNEFTKALNEYRKQLNEFNNQAVHGVGTPP